jgi:antitoxin component of MazEF toxin-antitoxin module
LREVPVPVKLCRWGNSLGVRLPKYVVERTGVHPGDYLFIRLTDAGDIVVRPVKQRDVAAAFSAADVAPERTTCLTREQIEEEWYK